MVRCRNSFLAVFLTLSIWIVLIKFAHCFKAKYNAIAHDFLRYHISSKIDAHSGEWVQTALNWLFN